MCSSSDPDKDVDSVAGPGLDVPSCRRAFQYLAKVSWTLQYRYKVAVVLIKTLPARRGQAFLSQSVPWVFRYLTKVSWTLLVRYKVDIVLINSIDNVAGLGLAFASHRQICKINL